MNRLPDVSRVFLLLLAVVSLGVSPAKGADKPLNFVVILVDDMGWTDLTCQGSKFYETPNVDRLAKEGMRFTDGYAACAVCSPTRAAVMTGRYPARVGVTDWIRARFQGGKIPADKKNRTEFVGRGRAMLCPPNPLWMEHEEVTLAEALKPAGYTSCHIGKWHLGADDWYPDRQGFTYNFGGCDFGQPPTYFSPYRIPTLENGPQGEYLTDREGEVAAKFIKDHQDKPFFLYMAHYAVHTPIQAKKDLTEKYDAKEKTNQKSAKYAAMVESVDDATGKILTALEEAGVADNTVVIFTSDNGGLMGPTNNAPLRSGKGFPFEGGIRVPWIVRWPGVVKGGTTSSEPIISVDILPTVLDAAGVDLPSGREIDGVSLVEHLKSEGTKSLGREAIYWHFPHYRHRPGPYSIIRAGEWKLIKYYEGPQYHLFNLEADLSEKKNLATDMPEKVKELDGQLMQHLKEVGAKVPRANPDYRAKK